MLRVSPIFSARLRPKASPLHVARRTWQLGRAKKSAWGWKKWHDRCRGAAGCGYPVSIAGHFHGKKMEKWWARGFRSIYRHHNLTIHAGRIGMESTKLGKSGWRSWAFWRPGPTGIGKFELMGHFWSEPFLIELRHRQEQRLLACFGLTNLERGCQLLRT